MPLKKPEMRAAFTAACHKVTCQLETIKIEFLPPNTTALIQPRDHPLDQGVIHAFQYRQIIDQNQICALERQISGPTCRMVKPQLIVNCFKKAKFRTTTYDTDSEAEYVSCDSDLQCYGQLIENDIMQS
ncbi:uncharacterized protein LOC129244356 [Anastrepha obliqua]|uniref:uncharacterized protein LOC129244356 n=1 Tax=Anastrepha obliqua TaxID=95512 RepID=UPI002409F868|nr:uncharacterized protein LOC129244356 [Anastrepha obliqua]